MSVVNNKENLKKIVTFYLFISAAIAMNLYQAVQNAHATSIYYPELEISSYYAQEIPEPTPNYKTPQQKTYHYLKHVLNAPIFTKSMIYKLDFDTLDQDPNLLDVLELTFEFLHETKEYTTGEQLFRFNRGYLPEYRRYLYLNTRFAKSKPWMKTINILFHPWKTTIFAKKASFIMSYISSSSRFGFVSGMNNIYIAVLTEPKPPLKRSYNGYFKAAPHTWGFINSAGIHSFSVLSPLNEVKDSTRVATLTEFVRPGPTKEFKGRLLHVANGIQRYCDLLTSNWSRFQRKDLSEANQGFFEKEFAMMNMLAHFAMATNFTFISCNQAFMMNPGMCPSPYTIAMLKQCGPLKTVDIMFTEHMIIPTQLVQH